LILMALGSIILPPPPLIPPRACAIEGIANDMLKETAEPTTNIAMTAAVLKPALDVKGAEIDISKIPQAAHGH
jgi:hypothetical protein